jgi:ketosteroid isomerase-like protein
MRYILFGMFVLAAAAGAFAADSTADQQAISKIERQWAEAFKTRDKSVYEKYIAENFTFIDEDGGFTDGRVQYIDNTMKLPMVSDYKVTDEEVRIYGSTAVATGWWSGTYVDATSFGAVRYTDTYVKGPDGWKAVASQETKTAEGEKKP